MVKEKKEKESSEEKKREKEYSERLKNLREKSKSGRKEIDRYKQELKTIKGAEKIAKERNDVGVLKQLRSEKENVYGGLTGERAKQVGRGILSAGTYAERTSGRLGQAVAKQFKKPLLKKPSVSIKTISSTKLLKQYANSNYPMFKSQGRDYSQSQEQIPQDNRSMFFNETFKKEQNTNRGWL